MYGGRQKDRSNPPEVFSPETVGAALGSWMLSLLFVNFASVHRLLLLEMLQINKCNKTVRNDSKRAEVIVKMSKQNQQICDTDLGVLLLSVR